MYDLRLELHQVPKMPRHNDKERSEWIDNDEWLHNLCQFARIPKRQWIKENRDLIDRVIDCHNNKNKQRGRYG